MSLKRKPTHLLSGIKAKFASVAGLEMTAVATRNAQALGYTLEDVVEAIQALRTTHFVKSETAHSPSNSKVWHDTYIMIWDGLELYLKFAGETLIDLTLTSFKEIEA
jgi:motility quorum-sensing regulator/GCU-specific mRNA interferase toxin